MITRQSLSLDDANAILAAGIAAAINVRPLIIAVVDDAGLLLAFARMDGARGYTVDLALQKARTSALVGVASSILAKAGAPSCGGGGLPVVSNGQCVGAVGVSGATEADDETVAREAISAFE
jgi:uncharacterized protein GlcG (DUF336 family)